MYKILVVEDSKLLLNFMRSSIINETGLTVDVAENSGQANELLSRNEYFAAVTDLNLPDCARGHMVDVLVEKGIPTIVYTGDYSEELREKMWQKRIVDYVLKRDPESDKYVSKMICQLQQNRSIDVIVVDDSIILRKGMSKLLESHLFRVHPCSNASDALQKAKEVENLKLVITDYMMPDMDGFEFVRSLRKDFPKDKLSIIGVSGTQKEWISAKFIKFGANDFMAKPFSNEQFYSRVNQNLQTIMMIENITNLSYKDYLTGLYNRRYFFAEMEKRVKKDKLHSIALLDIDFFKKVNDTYGHDGGDEVLKAVSAKLVDHVGEKGFVTRFGGEEFCIYIDSNTDAGYFDKLREEIAEMSIVYNEQIIRVTCSIGVNSSRNMSVNEMLCRADECLYEAKESGRNKVCSNC